MSFRSTRFERLDPYHYRVTGDLDLRGVTKPVVIDFEVTVLMSDKDSDRAAFYLREAVAFLHAHGIENVVAVRRHSIAPKCHRHLCGYALEGFEVLLEALFMRSAVVWHFFEVHLPCVSRAVYRI